MTREEILAIAKPILFNTDMVRAILDDRKTATRRKVEFFKGKNPNWTGYVKDGLMLYNGTNEPCIKPPRYKAGDYLYVRETWANLNTLVCPCYYYKANDTLPDWALGGWRPSIHMPKEAARTFLRVTDVRVERLQDIDGQDVLKEGINSLVHPKALYFDCNQREMFSKIWDSTISKKNMDKYGWDANPWVWTYQFERMEVG